MMTIDSEGSNLFLILEDSVISNLFSYSEDTTSSAIEISNN
jgi:hypothetical protein